MLPTHIIKFLILLALLFGVNPLAAQTRVPATLTTIPSLANPPLDVLDKAGNWDLLGTFTSQGYLPSNIATNNTQLASLPSTISPYIIRVGVNTVGDSEPVIYVPNATCPYDGGIALGGSCVATSDGKFWVLQPQPKMDLNDWAVFPNQGSGVDEGPGIRAACRFDAVNGVKTLVRGGAYYLLSTDHANGDLGAIYMGSESGPTTLPGCDMEGAVKTLYPYNGANDTGCGNSNGGPVEPEFILGPGLNRPLLFIGKFVYTPYWKGICLDGNRLNQSGWSGGPGGKLYTVEIEDWNSGVTTESAWRYDYVGIFGGYNGGLYEGSGRGSLWSEHSWVSYNGQTTSDIQVLFNGCDTTLINHQVGSGTGIGIQYNECAQHQMTDGAIFYNGNTGMTVLSNHTAYISIKGTNFQFNGCHGVEVLGGLPFPGTTPGSMNFVGVSFDQNSVTTTNTCDDFHQDDPNVAINLIAPSFNSTISNGPIARYNIYAQNMKVDSIGTPQTYEVATITAGNPSIPYTNEFVAGQRVYFTAFTMPTNLIQGTVYYVSSVGLSGSTFEVADTQAHAIAGTNIITPGTSGSIVVPHYATFDTAFTNNWTALRCANCNMQISWTPTISTDGTAGSPTYTSSGFWQRFNNQIVETFKVDVSSWTGTLTGHIQIGGSPFISLSNSNFLGTCSLTNISGWAGGSGYTMLAGFVSPNDTYIQFNEMGSGKSIVPSLIGNYTPPISLYGSCTFEVNQ